MTQIEEKLITVTRSDLPTGYQLVQSAHAIADFAHDLPTFFKSWKNNSNYLVSLAIQDEQSLNKLFKKLKARGAPVVAFHEPDIGNQLTAICFYGIPEYRKLTSHLPLALKDNSNNV